MPTPIQTGLLAYGMSGRVFHAPFLEAHPGFALAAVTERHEQQAHLQYPAVRSVASVEALLADEALELVVVNTPNNTHVEFARQALLAGKHVLLEKPVATTVAEIRELYVLSRRVNRHLLPYQNRRWDSDFQLVRQVVESGQLGRLVEVHFRFDRYKLALNKKTFKENPIPGSGLLYDLGPHLLDQVISLFGPPQHSYKALSSYRPGSKVDDYFTFHFRYASGLHVTVTSSLLVAAPGPAFALHGTAGSFSKLRADVQEAQLLQGISPLADEYGLEPAEAAGQLTLAASNGSLSHAVLPAPRGHYMGLFEAAYRTIRHGQPYPITEADIMAQLALLEQPPTAAS
ncbi:oxidoreductase [Hymenobacter sp. DG25B]|uniref:Gfo/Idh/MocA family protein n=1 Tax=Hymenobacter sp. DG25B TaxID=1385664 RepID=UPI000540C733|nr:Gfo/Idh/MocA family oxidoreductase [Hymenobacter sp. DG25B]AIZ62645.1 oxidoreductase [Hymenobacter sp. DG25B]